MRSGCAILGWGSSRKHLAPDYIAGNDLIKRKTYLLVSIKRSLLSLSKALSFLGGFKDKKILILTLRSSEGILSMLREIKRLKPSVSYFSYKWVAGYLTNNRVVKSNLEKEGEFKSNSKVKIYKRIYEGVVQTRGIPHILLVLSPSNRINVAIKEALSIGIPVIAIRDTHSRMSDKVTFPILINSGDIRIKEYLLRSIRNLIVGK